MLRNPLRRAMRKLRNNLTKHFTRAMAMFQLARWTHRPAYRRCIKLDRN